jgi:TetR/AcrR family transcriptional regulator, transcriptional repressor for nem operon
MSNSTKTELLHEASRMLLAKGLSFSLQELAHSLALKKASLFHYFPSKTVLVIELYRFYQQSFLDWLKRHENLAPEKQIITYAEKLTEWICMKDRVCPVGALSLEWHLVEPELQIEIKKLHNLQKQWLTKLFKSMQRNEGLKLGVSEAVVGTVAILQGSIQLARINNEPNLVKKNLKNYLKCIKGNK